MNDNTPLNEDWTDPEAWENAQDAAIAGPEDHLDDVKAQVARDQEVSQNKTLGLTPSARSVLNQYILLSTEEQQSVITILIRKQFPDYFLQRRTGK